MGYDHPMKDDGTDITVTDASIIDDQTIDEAQVDEPQDQQRVLVIAIVGVIITLALSALFIIFLLWLSSDGGPFAEQDYKELSEPAVVVTTN